MCIDISDILLSSKDRARNLKLPRELTEDLAYFCGVLAGDGSIFIRKEKYDYAIKCVGNPKDEQEFYRDVILPAIENLFGMKLKSRLFDDKTTYGFALSSKALVKFLTEKIGLPHGRKYLTLRIPLCFKKSKLLVFAFIQGVADTDFCFTHRGKHPVIVGASKSRRFIEEISEELEAIGITMYKAFDYKLKDSRFANGYSVINRIELSSKKSIVKWLTHIGFRSPKHLNKMEKWCEKYSAGWSSLKPRSRSSI